MPLLEFLESEGLVLCVRCCTVSKRSRFGLSALHTASGFAEMVRRRPADEELVRRSIASILARKLGLPEGSSVPAEIHSGDLDSLEIVELVMVLEEELGIDLDSATP